MLPAYWPVAVAVADGVEDAGPVSPRAQEDTRQHRNRVSYQSRRLQN